MSLCKIINKPYENKKALLNVANYIIQEEKCYGVYGCIGIREHYVVDIVEKMKDTKKLYSKNNGRQLVHIIISFDEYESTCLTGNDAMEIAYSLQEAFYGYQVLFGVHQNTEHLHIHFMVNTVSIITGRKFSINSAGARELEAMVERKFIEIRQRYNHPIYFQVVSFV
ncbi:MAG: relaxase/mobilization nuclease domain-containing protein [Eubacteriales bacterium]